MDDWIKKNRKVMTKEEYENIEKNKNEIELIDKYMNIIISTSHLSNIMPLNFKMDISEEEGRKIKDLDEIEQMDFLFKNGYRSEVTNYYKARSFNNILIDFIKFVETSIDALKKGNINVAYSLTRKAFKDNLFILEWLLIKSDEIIDYIGFDNVQKVSAVLENNLKKLKEFNIKQDYRKDIIEQAVDALDNIFLNKELIYELRFDKKKKYSLEPYWQQSMHIITSHKHYLTPNAQLNHIFMNMVDYESHFKFFSNQILMLIFYATNIILELYKSIVSNQGLLELKKNLELIGNLINVDNFIYHLDKQGEEYDEDDLIKATKELLEKKSLGLNCVQCGKEIDKDTIIENKIKKTDYLCGCGMKTPIIDITNQILNVWIASLEEVKKQIIKK